MAQAFAQPPGARHFDAPLVVHDEDDCAIPSEQSLELHRIRQATGIAGQLVLYRTRRLQDDAELIDRLYGWFRSFP